MSPNHLPPGGYAQMLVSPSTRRIKDYRTTLLNFTPKSVANIASVVRDIAISDMLNYGRIVNRVPRQNYTVWPAVGIDGHLI